MAVGDNAAYGPEYPFELQPDGTTLCILGVDLADRESVRRHIFRQHHIIRELRESVAMDQEQKMQQAQQEARAGLISAQRVYSESPQETRRTALHMALECARICPVADADSLIATAGKIEAYLRGEAT